MRRKFLGSRQCTEEADHKVDAVCESWLILTVERKSHTQIEGDNMRRKVAKKNGLIGSTNVEGSCAFEKEIDLLTRPRQEALRRGGKMLIGGGNATQSFALASMEH
jgi:hypothetical protein